MDINTIIYACIFLVQVVSTVFLINHKNAIIKDLKSLMEATDIKRLSEYYKAVDKLREKSIITQTKIFA